jgi:predicted unusual protein kinase regulating ubiquinone biosynthesis (AarF/ABC1/UbiB family)
MADRPAKPSPRRTAPAPIPEGRFGRFARIALAAGELAVGGAVESLRRRSAPASAAGAAASLGSALLTGANAERLAARLSKLRGAAMKLGQMLSIQGDELLPPEFAQALAVLRSGAAPMPPAQLHRVLGREYGKGWENRFDGFDDRPIAAASIGQVHRVRTRDGRDLALKIQYPGVARSIGSDVDNLATLLRLANVLPLQLDIGAITAESKRQLGQESDYLAESRFLRRYARLVTGMREVLVPKVHMDLTSPRILAMDFVDGVPLESLAESDVPQAERDRVGTVLQGLLFRELFEFRVMQTDPNFGNYLYQPATGRIVLLDFGSTQAFETGFVDAYARITRAVIDGDLDAVGRHAAAIGYVAPGDPPERVRAAVDVIRLVCEPLCHRGPYDFAASDLPARARATALDLALRRGLLRSPPPETIFLHRKLAGSFFMLARIGARVDSHRLVMPFLSPR